MTDEMREARLPGGLGVWQGGALGVGGMLLSAVIGTNVMQERMAADRAALVKLEGQVSVLVTQVNALNVEIVRQSEQMQQLRSLAAFRSSEGLRPSRN